MRGLKSVGIFSILVGLAFVLTACAGRSEAEIDRIAFASDRSDYPQFDIHVMRVDGTNIKRVTRDDEGIVGIPIPSWSPDGKRIVYASSCAFGPFECQISVMNDDGSRDAVLSDYGSFPSWSPDGAKIVFSRPAGERFKPLEGSLAEFLQGVEFVADEEAVRALLSKNSDLYVMDIDGGNLNQLTNTPDLNELLPAWSPDSTKVIYSAGPSEGNYDIYVVNADGSGRRRLTTHPATDSAPQWSPDGTRILFESNQDGDFEIYVMDSTGGEVTQLTSNIGFSDTNPAWSPDGEKIVFVSERGGLHINRLYIMDADGTGVSRITNSDFNVFFPRWAPRKRRVEVSD